MHATLIILQIDQKHWNHTATITLKELIILKIITLVQNNNLSLKN